MPTIPLPDGVNHVVTFAEYARVGGELDAARLERDRLTAENAELRKQCAAFHAEANDHYRATLAANATLDALREKFGHHKPLPFCHNCDSYKTEWQNNECLNCGVNLDTSSLMLCDMYAILDPQPAALAEEKTNGN